MHIGLPAVRGKNFKVMEKSENSVDSYKRFVDMEKSGKSLGDLVMNAHNKSIVLLSQSGHVSGRAGGQRAAARLVEPISL